MILSPIALCSLMGQEGDRRTGRRRNKVWRIGQDRIYLKNYVTRLQELGYEGARTEELAKRKASSLEPDEAVFYELSSSLNTHFGLGLGGFKDQFTSVFGSVLADLPEYVFTKLREMKNLCFIFTPNPGAEVKHITFEHDIAAGQELYVATFPFMSHFASHTVARGEIAHELAHVYAEHRPSANESQEDETDEIAKSWGFEKEIAALREFEREYWGEEG